MTESRRAPSGCAMFGIYSGMFRRRRSASMSSLSRINGSPQAAAADSDAAPANPAQRKAGVTTIPPSCPPRSCLCSRRSTARRPRRRSVRRATRAGRTGR
ncbi:hypothetical protein ZWY2020_022364 [Hordeum vulgare]|nr:hypothetical protein ZWY2020_022364 [Hordeum vulgare]